MIPLFPSMLNIFNFISKVQLPLEISEKARNL